MKRLSTKLGFLLGGFLLAFPGYSATYGDVTGDGNIDIADVNLVINVMLGKTQSSNADVNGDASIDIADVNEVINIMLAKVVSAFDPETDPLPKSMYADALLGDEWTVSMADDDWQVKVTFSDDGSCVITDCYDIDMNNTFTETAGPYSGRYILNENVLKVRCSQSVIDGTYTISEIRSRQMILIGEDGGVNVAKRNRGLVSRTFEGNGTLAKPYLIQSAADLRKLSDDVSQGVTYRGEYLKITNDIIINHNVLDEFGDLNGTFGTFEQWKPIGAGPMGRSFCGTLNGNGCSIKGLFMRSNQIDTLGLFYSFSGRLMNLTISDSYFEGFGSGRRCIGSFAGYACSTSYDGIDYVPRFESCANEAVVVNNASGWGEHDATGGLVGYAYGVIYFNKCINRGNVTCVHGDGTGGIIGEMAYVASVVKCENCINEGKIEGYQRVGGIMGGHISVFTGSNDSVVVINCLNRGVITATDASENATCGGIIGKVWYQNDAVFRAANCVNIGRVSNLNAASSGGLFGMAYKAFERHIGKTMVESCYYLETTSPRGYGTKHTDYSITKGISVMTETQMKAQTFLGVLNSNVSSLGSKYSRWKFDSNGYPTLEWDNN